MNVMNSWVIPMHFLQFCMRLRDDAARLIEPYWYIQRRLIGVPQVCFDQVNQQRW